MPEDRLRLVQVGAGAMGRAWLQTIAENPGVTLVGLVDLDLSTAGRAAAATGHDGVRLGRSLADVIDASGADAVINVTVPAAHREVSIDALDRGVPVLCEKPMAESVAECLPMIAAAERAGRLLMVSQSRRYWSHLTALRALIAQLGAVETLHCELVRAPHFGGFRETMAEPLLVDMAIHQFDLARFLMSSDPVGVICDSYNPSWSWFAGNAAATAIFEFSGGERFTFAGSWCGPPPETSWNGSWRIGTGGGAAAWDGDHAPTATAITGSPLTASSIAVPEQLAGSLAEFVAAVRDSSVPDTVARRNVVSVAMVEAAVRSSARGRKVTIDEILDDARSTALDSELDPELRRLIETIDVAVATPRGGPARFPG